jgi:DNA recombination protein RmuC
METPLLYAFAFLLIGLLIGGAGAWLLAGWKARAQAQTPDSNRFIARELHDMLRAQLEQSSQRTQELEAELRLMGSDLARSTQTVRHLDEKLAEQKAELSRLQEHFQREFERVATRLLEEKSHKFTAQNHEQLQTILSPLRERISAFEEGFKTRFLEETRDRVSLKTEIENLRLLNQQLSQDANNLATALKGDNKVQGDWGEVQLELLLQKAGLEKGISYDVQSSFSDDEGRQKRPDFIIRLPDEKNLILDSKVSLVAYARYCQASTDAERQKALQEHIESLRRHIRGLGEKKYEQLYHIQSPDYTLLFVPLEPAFALAVQQDHKLFTDALERNIVLVSTSTLLATLRTVSFIWKQDIQKKSVQEIARQSGRLYDTFCAFVEDLSAIGKRLDQAQDSYRHAFAKLKSGGRYGDTLVGRAERIRELGAKNSKLLPKDLREPDDSTPADPMDG